ncbi:hypothetical protein [Nocardia mangyaensis]|uniref:hypothetical protein n=1 Tax=Nocardia mangyaensis TaxID=2213200 RepID=UPI00267703CB|nr:hypothetical protein [Nocardia mangyaensis]MDO3646587.1 hypothetical protein [Nocardia mangyaensis]
MSVQQRVSATTQFQVTHRWTLEHLLNEHDRRLRFAAVAAAYAEADADYVAEFDALDDTVGDGLDEAR